MTIETYFTMNARIVAILRQGSDPMALYAAQRIEELELISGVRYKCLVIAMETLALYTEGSADGVPAQGTLVEIEAHLAELEPEESAQ